MVLDWNMWSRQRRADAVRRAAELGVPCHLHHLVVPLEVAIERATDRTRPACTPPGRRAIRHLSTIFEEPTGSEGYTLHVVSDR